LAKSSSSRKARGHQSVKKGKAFEEKVAAIYRLLGAKITPNIEINSKKVDLFITLPVAGASSQHRIIVECKDSKPKNQQEIVSAFHSLLIRARNNDQADSVEIITTGEWSDPAKAVARETGVALLTYEQKLAQLMSFESYLQGLVNRFEDGDHTSGPPLAKYYVDSRANITSVVESDSAQMPSIGERPEYASIGTNKKRMVVQQNLPVVEYLGKWASDNQDSRRPVAILGGYGIGKSTLCRKMARDLAARYLQNRSGRIPLLFNLRDFTKTMKIESLITNFLDEECGVDRPRFQLFRAMNEAGIFLLIFDGLDEMAVKVDARTLEINLNEIEKIIKLPRARALITSREEHFVNQDEENSSLSPKHDKFFGRSVVYHRIYLRYWDDEQIDEFLKKRIPLVEDATEDWVFYRNRLRAIPDLNDLSKRPVLLEMIANSLPSLIASGQPINRPSLYQNYLLGELRRQEVRKGRELLLSTEQRLYALQDFAVGMYAGEIEDLRFDVAKSKLESLIKGLSGELDVYARDFLSCSFLQRKKDLYVFSHESFSEYLVAKALALEIERDDPVYFTKTLFGPVVLGFLAEMDIDTRVLWEWFDMARGKEWEDALFLGSNTLSLLLKIDREAAVGKDLSNGRLLLAELGNQNLSGADLSGSNLLLANLSGADLRGAKLTRSDSRGVIFSSARLERCEFRGANLTSGEILQVPRPRAPVSSGAELTTTFGADLSGLDFREANLSGTELLRANLLGSNLSGADLRRANLMASNLSDANLQGADLSGASLIGAGVSGADLRQAKFSQADLSGVNLAVCETEGADFSAATMPGGEGDFSLRYVSENLD